MFLITDKLDKSEIKYDLMKDEKCISMDSENVEYTGRKPNTTRLMYLALIGMALITAAAWLMLTSNHHSYRQYDAEKNILTNVFDAVNKTNAILNDVDKSVSIISEYNVRSALDYVETIQEILKVRTRYSIQQINRIITDKIREIENELTSFDYVITEASGGIVDYLLQEMKTLRESVSSITNSTYQADFENIFKVVQEKLESAFEDLDSMYTFYTKYMGDIIDKKVHNATDRISVIINSNRKRLDSTVKEKVNLCYTISTQNVKISSQLESLVEVFAVVNNATDILDSLELILLENTDQYSRNLLSEARTVLNQATVKSETVLETVLKDDNCFLGSTVQKVAFESHLRMKDFILNSFETSIQSLAKNLNATTGNFEVVQEKHRNEVEQDVIGGLTAIADKIRSKANDLTPSAALEEYVEKSSFSSIRQWMDTKFQNLTDTMNPMFRKRQQEIAEGLKYTLQYIVFQQLPYVSSLSVQNYLPRDVCPLSADFQKFITITLDQYLDPTAQQVKEGLNMTHGFSQETDTTQFINDEIENSVGDYSNPNDNCQDVQEIEKTSEDSTAEQDTMEKIVSKSEEQHAIQNKL